MVVRLIDRYSEYRSRWGIVTRSRRGVARLMLGMVLCRLCGTVVNSVDPQGVWSALSVSSWKTLQLQRWRILLYLSSPGFRQ
jgi:hypothetical protein